MYAMYIIYIMYTIYITSQVLRPKCAGTRLQQRTSRVHVPIPCRDVERGRAVVVGLVDVGLGLPHARMCVITASACVGSSST